MKHIFLIYLTDVFAGHGCGFWDGEWPLNGDLLTQWCSTYQYKIEPCIGDDGKVYLRGGSSL